MLFNLALLGAALGIAYVSVTIFYRLYLSRLSSFPGPKLAAMSFLPQFYYDVICQGKYLFKMRELHARYGPVIRINPYELHVLDVDFIDTLYTHHSHKRDKWGFYTEIFATPGASMNTNNHDLHRTRRSALNPFFSKGAIRNLLPLVDGKVDQLLERLEGSRGSGEVIMVNHVTSAFTHDVVTEFCFGSCHDRLGHPEFDSSFYERVSSGCDMIPFLAFFPFIMRALEALPQFITLRLSPDYEQFLAEKHEVYAEARKVMQSPKTAFEANQHRTIFHEILDSKLPEGEKSLDRLADEAALTVSAGTLTTAWCLAVGIFYILNDPAVLTPLKTELKEAIPDPAAHVPLTTLEALPYLKACVQETIRLGYGAPGRLCHIAPDEPLIVQNSSGPDGKPLVIPPGTPTCMTVYLQHHIESIFPDSLTFSPQRWLDNPRLDKHLFAFGKGSRGCAGINLAYAEMTIAIARIFRNYGSPRVRFPGDKGVLELFETGKRDIELESAMVLVKAQQGTKGIRMRVQH